MNEFEPNANIQPFRFWVQKILPLVYDDSMSYYELLCKVVEYLNQVIENINNVENGYEYVYNALIELRNYVDTYFTSLDVQTAINKALDQMVSDGTFDAALERVVSANINGVVSEQIGDAVENQIYGVVGDLIGGAVEDAISDDVESIASATTTQWLRDNITTPSTVVIDSSLSISGAAAEAKTTGDKIAIGYNENSLNIYDVLEPIANYNDPQHGGITFDYDLKNDTVRAHGTATGTFGWNVLYANESGFPKGMSKGKDYYLYLNNTNIQLQIFEYIAGSWTAITTVTSPTWYRIGNSASGITIRLRVPTVSGRSYDYTEGIPKILNMPPIDYFNKTMTILPDGTNLNNITSNSFWLINSEYSYINAPANLGGGFLISFPCRNFNLQIIFSYTGADVYKRKSASGNWDNWTKLTGGVVNNEYNNYTSNYNITSYPELSSLGNDLYLESTGDNTDRTADIAQLLQTYGCCNLGSGVFVVTNLDMPAHSILQGYGNATLKLSESGTYAVNMGSYCSIRDLNIIGGDSDIPIGTTFGNRKGILWQGNYSTDTSDTVFKGYIDNVKISRFNDSGILCYNTGYGTDSGINVSNVFIENCTAGLNIAYWSEYCKFVNVSIQWCYYGCINNGGNNMFANCDFSHNRVGFFIDNENNTSINNSHGSCTGCIFNHMLPDNTGDGIRIINASYGYVFTGCQINSKINIVNSRGIIFTGNGMSGYDIRIEGGDTVAFNGNNFSTIPTRLINNNNKVFFNNCYSSSGTPVT